MSIHLMSLVWEIDFPTPTQKLMMLRFADYANDDGDSIFPSNEEVARQCQVTKRGAQYVMSGFRNIKLLQTIHEGGNGPKDTNRYRMNVDLLIELAYQLKRLEGAKEKLQLVDNKGELSAPLSLRRMNRIAVRVNQLTDKGEPGFTQSINNHHIETSDACASASDGSRAAPACGRPKLVITKTDAQWSTWLEHLKQQGDADLLDHVSMLGELEASSRWPAEGVEVFTKVSKPKTNLADRITGEGS